MGTLYIPVLALLLICICQTLAQDPCAKCRDKVNGFCWRTGATAYCSCKAGYKMSNGRCIDVNECTTGLHDCDTSHGRCLNTIGGYKCLCNCNYMLDYSKTRCLLASKVTGICNKRALYTPCYRGKKDSMDEDEGHGNEDGEQGQEEKVARDEKILTDEESNEDDERRDSRLLQMLMDIQKMRDGNVEEEEYDITDEDEEVTDDERDTTKALSYKDVMVGKDAEITEKAGACKCEAGYKRNRCGRCEDINECASRATHKCAGTCVNSYGGYYCQCAPPLVLGPCGHRCYYDDERPATCTTKGVTAAHLGNKELAEKDGITTSQLLNALTEKAGKLGIKYRPIQLSHYGRCYKKGQKGTDTFDLDQDGKTDITVSTTCGRSGSTYLWKVTSVVDKEAKWRPWSCWSECKPSCYGQGGVQVRQRRCKSGLSNYGNCRGPSTQTRSCYSGKKCPLRIRKSATTLTVAEQKDLIQAMNKYKADMYSTYGYHAAAGTHSWPNQCVSAIEAVPSPCCYHGAKLNFVMFHRAEVKNYEIGLTRHLKSKTLGVPYWDWITSIKPPKLIWNKRLFGAPNPFHRMAVKIDENPVRYTQRSPVFSKSMGNTARNYFLNQVVKLMRSNKLHVLSEAIETAHNSIHGGACQGTSNCVWSMGNLVGAAFDPLFFFHHTNVDRIFAMYQNQALRFKELKWNRQAALEAQENIYHFNQPYRPFHNATLTPWISARQVSSMEDMYYYKELMGYKYDTLNAHGTPLTAVEYIESHIAQNNPKSTLGKHQLYINQFQRNMGQNVLLRYFYAGTSRRPIKLAKCCHLSNSNANYMGQLLILGNKGERPWKNAQPTPLDVTSFMVKKKIAMYRGDLLIKSCPTSDIYCKTKNCPDSKAPCIKELPSPNFAYYPAHTAIEEYRFRWELGQVFPKWEINLQCGKEWMLFTGKERANVVQVTSLAAFNSCNSAGGLKINCHSKCCILPRGAHYFIHKNRSKCRRGLKLHILGIF